MATSGNLVPYQPINTGTILSLCKTLYADYSTTTDSNYKASLSNVLTYKVSTLTTFVTLNNQNLLADIAKIKPS